MGNVKLITCCCFVVVCFAILWQIIWPTPKSFVSFVNSEYDFIIVGAGTAGCVLAARLSESQNVRILLIEAGDQFGFASKVPILPTIMQKGSNDWSFSTEPQIHSSFGLINKIQFLPRGKGLGGSGQINYLLHGVGIPKDFDTWATMGARGWQHTDIEPYIKNNFYSPGKLTESVLFENELDPGIKLSDTDNKLLEMSRAFIDSSRELPKHMKMDVQNFQNTIHKGQRESSYKVHLLPALNRGNLHVLKNALVTKINFEGNYANSVEILKDKMFQYASAKNEIILCAGSLHTPHLLMLSGVGPKEELDKYGIEKIAVSEGVGSNLHDHLNIPLYISIQQPITMTVNKIRSLKSMFTYFWEGKGFLASPGVIAIGRGEENAAIILFAMGSVDEVLLREIANFRPKIFRSLFPFYNDSDKEGFIFLNTCLQPSSRGYVKLKNTNPSSLPLVNPKYLSDLKDIKCIIRAIRLTIEVIKTPTFQRLGAVIHWPKLVDCKHLWKGETIITDDYLECIIRFTALTGHHAAGTCSMAGNTSVVDSTLMVNGVKKLSIVDASILPTPVSSPPNSVIIAIAEKAAQIIKERHNITSVI